MATITEGDLLRKLARTEGMRLADSNHVRLDEVPVRRVIHAVGIDAEVEELFNRAIEQNFVRSSTAAMRSSGSSAGARSSSTARALFGAETVWTRGLTDVESGPAPAGPP